MKFSPYLENEAVIKQDQGAGEDPSMFNRYSVYFGLAAAMVAASPVSAHDINSFRRANGLPRLQASAQLARAASAHARDMARRNQLDHDGFRTRMDGFRTRMGGYSVAAENVASGCANADCAFKMWENSDGHRRN